jgi:hypothetical protein
LLGETVVLILGEITAVVEIATRFEGGIVTFGKAVIEGTFGPAVCIAGWDFDPGGTCERPAAFALGIAIAAARKRCRLETLWFGILVSW